jgi:hypothetical protein
MTQNKKLTVNEELLRPIPAGVPTVEIAKSIGFTVNLQAYESARIDCSVKINGALEDIEIIKAEVTKQLEAEVKEAIGQLVEQHDTRKTLLGYSK